MKVDFVAGGHEQYECSIVPMEFTTHASYAAPYTRCDAGCAGKQSYSYSNKSQSQNIKVYKQLSTAINLLYHK